MIWRSAGSVAARTPTYGPARCRLCRALAAP